MALPMTDEQWEETYRTRWLEHYAGDPIEFVQITATNTVQSLVVPDLARSALLQADGATVRFTFGNEQPSPTVGFQALAGEKVELSGIATMKAFLYVREGSADVPAFVQYFQ